METKKALNRLRPQNHAQDPFDQTRILSNLNDARLGHQLVTSGYKNISAETKTNVTLPRSAPTTDPGVGERLRRIATRSVSETSVLPAHLHFRDARNFEPAIIKRTILSPQKD